MKNVVGIVVAIVAGILGYTLAKGLVEKNRGSDLKPMAEAAVAPGWKRHEVSAARFSIQLPVEFTGMDPKSPQLDKILEEAVQANPEAGPLMRRALSQSNFAFWAFNFKSVHNGFADNINVVRVPSSGSLPTQSAQLEEHRRQLQSGLPPGSRVHAAKLVDLPVGSFVFSELGLQLTGATGPQATRSFCYAYRRDGQDTTITFTTLDSRADDFRPIAEKAMQTFRVLD